MDRSETLGLGVSTAGHALLIAALGFGLLHWSSPRVLAPAAIEVALADRIALESRSTAQAEPQVAQAPELGPLEPDAAPAQAEPQPAPKPEPKAVASPEPKKSTPAEQKKRADALKASLDKIAPTTGKTGRAQRLGDDFLKGLDAPSAPARPTAPNGGNAPLDAVAARALNAEISRQVKPFWNPPTGVDVDKLVTIVAVTLGPDGSIQGRPRMISQSGVTATNASQKGLHAENAIRAVRLAAPFKLPPDLYDAWQSLEIRFDYRLSR
jgi:pyruvate/2-oxoglutarate dehydrogenase complex dihydrolipoamide acyltransferase (E2) component